MFSPQVCESRIKDIIQARITRIARIEYCFFLFLCNPRNPRLPILYITYLSITYRYPGQEGGESSSTFQFSPDARISRGNAQQAENRHAFHFCPDIRRE